MPATADCWLAAGAARLLLERCGLHHCLLNCCFVSWHVIPTSLLGLEQMQAPTNYQAIQVITVRSNQFHFVFCRLIMVSNRPSSLEFDLPANFDVPARMR